MTTTQPRPVEAGAPDDQPDWTLNRPVFLTAAAVTLAVTIWCVALPDQAYSTLETIVGWVSTSLGWYYIALTTFMNLGLPLMLGIWHGDIIGTVLLVGLLRLVVNHPQRFDRVVISNTGLPYNPDVPEAVVKEVEDDDSKIISVNNSSSKLISSKKRGMRSAKL